MATFGEILESAQVASQALSQLEETASSRVFSFFLRFENGLMPYGELRIELLRQTKTGFVTAGSVAIEHVRSVARSAGVTGLDTPIVSDSPVLDRLLDDLRKNLETYRDSERDEKALRRLRFRVGLTVQTAVRRGFTESQLAAGEVLRSRGAALRKMWLANFTNNSPCEHCRALHGTEVNLSEDFSHGNDRAPGVYMGLPGPPRHPNCHCYMVVYVVTLDSVAKAPAAPVFVDERFMTARDVRRLPRAAYTAVLATLRLIAGKLKGAFRGKR